ncbi:MAG TPA: hypothetical protein VIT62_06480 [Lysobacter sp.]
MGLSLSVLVALALLAPGASFFFGLSRLHSPTSPATVLDQHISVGLILAVLAALAGHGSAIWLIDVVGSRLGVPVVDPAQAIALLAGDVTTSSGEMALSSLRQYPVRTAAYLLTLTVVMWKLGKVLNSRLSKRKTASWYDLLRPAGASFVVVTADLQLNSECFLYSGVVEEFSIAKCGNLERLVLAFAARKPLSQAGLPPPKDISADPRSLGHGWLEIPGEFVVLQMKEARTINLDYFFEGAGEDAPEPDAPEDDGPTEANPA